MKFHIDGAIPKAGEIFVFGSNLKGDHEAGAARAAYDYYGAIWGQGIGRMGKCYALPTLNKDMEVMELDSIKHYVDALISHMRLHPKETFFITRFGCGIAGYRDEDIAPMFLRANLDNCSIAESWRPLLIV